MLEERIIDLIQRDVDNQTDPREKNELQQRLERDPEARRYYDGMFEVAQILRSAPSDEPPSSFTSDVMDAIRASAAERAPHVARPDFGKHRDRFLAVRVGVGLAAAVLVALVLAPSLFRALDPSRLGGTMVKPAVNAPLQEQRVDAGLGTTVQVGNGPNEVTLRFEVPAGTSRTVDITFNPETLRATRVEGASSSRIAAGEAHFAFDRSAVVHFERSAGIDETLTVTVKDGARVSSTTIKQSRVTNF